MDTETRLKNIEEKLDLILNILGQTPLASACPQGQQKSILKPKPMINQPDLIIYTEKVVNEPFKIEDNIVEPFKFKDPFTEYAFNRSNLLPPPPSYQQITPPEIRQRKNFK
jgi:hypothetical protein